jgi:hypothetical protein
MTDKDHREYEEGEGSLDPELLYTKEYCIGWSPPTTRPFSEACGNTC